MKKIKKYFSEKDTDLFEKKLENYSTLAEEFISTGNYIASPKKKNSFNSLQVLVGLAATALVPNLAEAQCTIYGENIDVNGDGQADVFISPFSYFQSAGSQYANIYQWRALGVGSNTVQIPGSGPGIPRSCYFYSCLFPYANGATVGPAVGNVGVLLSNVVSCFASMVTNQNCNTFTTTYGATSMTCTTTSYTTFNCAPPIVRGNFEYGVPGTLAVQVNGTFHFIELTLGATPFVTAIDGVTAQPCDGGCQDTMLMVGNNVFLQPLYHAEEIIETNNIVEVSGDVTLKAGESITLKEGFHAKSGGEFLGQIEACVPPGSFVAPHQSEEVAVIEEKKIVAKTTDIHIGDVFPNPSSTGNFKLKIDLPKEELIDVEIYEMKGLLLEKKSYRLPSGSSTIELDLNTFKNGTYFSKVKIGEDVFYRKLVVMKE